MDSKIIYSHGGGNEQYTPYYAVEILLPYIQHLKNKIIWLPCDTEESEFVKILKQNGFKVVYSHISHGKDFFNYEPDNWDVILTNPPYENKRKFIERAESFKKPWCFLLPVNMFNDRILNEIFGNMQEMTCLIPDKRIRFFNNFNKVVGNKVNFKAIYIGRNFFTRQIIGVNFDKKINLNNFYRELNLF